MDTAAAGFAANALLEDAAGTVVVVVGVASGTGAVALGAGAVVDALERAVIDLDVGADAGTSLGVDEGSAGSEEGNTPLLSLRHFTTFSRAADFAAFLFPAEAVKDKPAICAVRSKRMLGDWPNWTLLYLGCGIPFF